LLQMGTIPLNPPYQRGTFSIVGWVEVTKPNKPQNWCWAVPER